MRTTLKNMDLGQTITILANIGVIAGILFLAFELRQNNEQLEIQFRGQMTSYRNAIPELVLENLYLIDLQRKAVEELTQSERDRLAVLGLRLLLNF